VRLDFWNNSASRSVATPLQAAVSAEREQRSAGAVAVSTESNDARLLGLLGLGGGEVAGVPVTQQAVMSIAAAYACVNNISQDVAGLPCQLFREVAGGRERASGHPASPALNVQASPLQNSFHFRQSMTALTLLRGNAYARIEPATRRQPMRLHFKHPDETDVFKSGGRLWYRFSGDPKTYPDYAVIHLKGLSLDGVLGVSVLHYFRETFGKQLAASKSHTSFYKNGARPSGALETDAVLTDDGAVRLAASFANKYTGMENSGKPLLLEQGLKYRAISLTPQDAEFISTHKLTRSDIASIFRMPPHKIGDLERSTNNNIEQQSLDYVGDTLTPILLAQEQEYRLKLLRTDEVETHYFRHNITAQLRSDATARGNFYAKLFQVGAFSPNDILALEDRNGIGEAGDERFIPVNMAPLSRIGELTDAAIAARAKGPATPPANDPPEND